jgi:hypothetical protein
VTVCKSEVFITPRTTVPAMAIAKRVMATRMLVGLPAVIPRGSSKQMLLSLALIEYYDARKTELSTHKESVAPDPTEH